MIKLGFVDPKFLIITDEELFVADDIPEDIADYENVRIVDLSNHMVSQAPTFIFTSIDKI